MDLDETMVEEEFDDAVEDDTLPDGIIEADESDDEDFPDEEDLELPDEDEVEDEEYSEEEEEETPEPEPPKEPGWIKQRVQKAVDKAVAQALAAQQEQFNAQIAPLIAKMQEDEAQELVRSRKIADIETAREFVRLKNGQGATENPVATQQPSPPRNEQGQFASREQIETETRINELKKQAEKIKAKGGPDVISEFMNNEDIKRRVVNGELDFYEVAEMMRAKPKRKPPSPMRSPNGAANVTPNAFMSMSDEQFDRIEKQLDKGVRYTFK